MKTTNASVGEFEAKSKFSEILVRVIRGAEVTITKDGQPVAKLVPVLPSAEAARKRAAIELRALSKRYSLKGHSIRKLIDGGRE